MDLIETLNNINPAVLYAGAGAVAAVSISLATYLGIRRISDNRLSKADLESNPETIRARSEAEIARANKMQELLKDPNYIENQEKRLQIGREFTHVYYKANTATPPSHEVERHINAVLGESII